MTRSLRLALMGLVLLALAACNNMFSGNYFGPEVTSVVVYKADRKMYLFNGDEVLKAFDLELGTNPVGHKQFEGDGKTPEGLYYITHRNANSRFYLSLGISYPNAQDVAYATAQDLLPGGDIFIHGQSATSKGKNDWTVGCIAVTNPEMDVIFAMVAPGTPIWIKP